MSDNKPNISISLHIETVYDLEEAIVKAGSLNYQSLTIPIVHHKFLREFVDEKLKRKHECFTRSDLLLSPCQWLNRVICMVSEVDCDSDNENIRKTSEKTMLQELGFAEHIVQNGYILTRLSSSNCLNLAKTITHNLKGVLLVEVPITDPKSLQSTWRNDLEDDVEFEDPWHWWNNFRVYSDHSPHVKLALELSPDVPTKSAIYRWLGEPVDSIVISSNIFLTNSRNYPVLPKAHQDLVVLFHQTMGCNFIVKANVDDRRLASYSDYIRYITTSNYVKDPMQGYDDLLEVPLQPLYDNLDSYTYEIFEKDPVKYILYQKAVEAALIDTAPDEIKDTKKVIIMVVGAGRGPLVKAALNASVNTGRSVKVYAIEKNPNAIVTIAALINEMWSEFDVELISTDMREFDPPEKADIIISELLGSFGDNELSPECLDGVQRHLKPNGISIPSKSTSYLNPCMAQKVFNQIVSLGKLPNSKHRARSSSTMEGAYVAYLKQVYHIDEPKSLFTFVHPNNDQVIDNTRYKRLKFTAELDCILHGFAGYFDTVLYKDIILSINPQTHTKGLVSWFSMFFPLTEPQQIKAGEEIEIAFWRCLNSHKVWYEWALVAPRATHIHNKEGRTYEILT